MPNGGSAFANETTLPARRGLSCLPGQIPARQEVAPVRCDTNRDQGILDATPVVHVLDGPGRAHGPLHGQPVLVASSGLLVEQVGHDLVCCLRCTEVS